MARVGSQHMTLFASGERKQVAVGDRTRFPNAALVCRCLTCGLEAPTAPELEAAHQALQHESHVWAYWSHAAVDDTTRGLRLAMLRLSMPPDQAHAASHAEIIGPLA